MGLDRLATAWLDSPSPPDVAVTTGDRLGGECVLAPLLSDATPILADQIDVASALANATDATLRIVAPLAGAERTADAPARPASGDGDAALVEWARARASRSTGRVGGGLTGGRQVVTEVAATAATRDVGAVVLPGESPGGLLRGGVSERIAAHVDCDAVVVNGQSGLGAVPSLLLPIAGGPHSGLAADVAARVAAVTGAWIDVLHVVEEGATGGRRRRADACVRAAARRIDRPETTSTWVLDADDPAAAIVEQSRYYPLTVIGAPTRGRLRRFVHGSTNESVRSNAHSVVLSVRASDERSLAD
jgi:nucleotide-binding universal stress UspA family protein